MCASLCLTVLHRLAHHAAILIIYHLSDDGVIVSRLSHNTYLVRWWSRDRCSGRLRWRFQTGECVPGTLEHSVITHKHASIQSVDWPCFTSGYLRLQYKQRWNRHKKKYRPNEVNAEKSLCCRKGTVRRFFVICQLNYSFKKIVRCHWSRHVGLIL